MKIQLSTDQSRRSKNTQKSLLKMPIAVYKSGLSILATKDYEQLYSHIYKELHKLIGADYISIYRVVNDNLEKVYTSFAQLTDIKPRKHGYTYRAYQESVPYVLDNTKVLKIHPELEKFAIPSTLFIPLKFDNEPMGVISVDFHKNVSFSPEILELLKLFGSLVTFKIKNLNLQHELKKLAESRELFISLASHELKNPLTSVLAYSQIMQQQLKKKSVVDPDLLDKLTSEVHRISQLTDELLSTPDPNIAEIKLRYRRNNHHLATIIRHAISNFKVNYEKRVIYFYNRARTDTVNGDYHKLLQLFGNILNNAAKFSSKRSSISIHLAAGDTMLNIKIVDRGKGIAQKDLPHIFKRYFKGHASTQNTGMGLGLYLCKKIVAAHYGTIRFHSIVKKGTTVEIQLPITYEQVS